jgi:glucose/arabinose dehydrogenase
MLVQGEFTEPTELAVLPDGDVVVVERRGRVLRYRAADGSLDVMAQIPVYWQTGIEGVNAEEGLLGVTADPDFADNRYLYLFYSPEGPSVNRLSRFTLGADSLLLGSERVILEFFSQRQICCHTGGSLAFGPDGNLYLSTGDNSTPFDVPNESIANHGFAPLDNRPGLEQYDARRTSANTNDLRGKIIRIRIEPDGSYTSPEGNLFPPGTPDTRPEIYAMGTRNAYRLSIDPETGFVYWGDVGPDANEDSLATRGPRGYDEINQARGPGFFGWPLFIADNQPYRHYDFATGESGPAFDPAAPVNESASNTGRAELPPAQPAFIWYPYGESRDFPEVGTGGRTALAGPVYRADRYPEATRLPGYYDGKLFIYDWLRHWIKVVTLTPEGDYEAMEPFLPDVKFAGPIDLELGPDGSLYLLEYGIGWFAQNPDAGLSRIEAARAESTRRVLSAPHSAR